MEIATTLVKYLADHSIAYDRLVHRHTASSLDSARVTNIPGNEVAKSVILEDEQGYVMAVVPATRHVKIGELNRLLGRHMGLATEPELARLFSDCELGAIPPVGQAYGMQTVVDDSLDQCNDIYFEAGNHEELIHIKGNTFRKLMKDTRHAPICVH